MAILALGVLLMAGCTRHAYISDRTLSAPRNIPPIRNDTTFTVVAVDGHSFRRGTTHWLPGDWYPEVVVDPGIHLFKVSAAPATRPPHYVEVETEFTATVESGKEYFIYSKSGSPALIEARPMDK